MPDPITLSQTWIVNWAAWLVTLLPLGYAFAAGMVSTVNPCGFAILPAYMSLYVGADEKEFSQRSFLIRLAEASYVGLVVTLGFVVLFGIVGLGIAAGGYFLVRAMPWAGLVTGVILAIIGGLLLSGKRYHSSLLARLGTRVRVPRSGGPGAYFLFGIGYAVASLACTLPIFLVVVGSSIAAGGVLAGFSQFISYALGMGLVLVILTQGIALFKGAIEGSLDALRPHVERISAVLILMMGSYLVYYWLTKGGLLRYFT